MIKKGPKMFKNGYNKKEKEKEKKWSTTVNNGQQRSIQAKTVKKGRKKHSKKLSKLDQNGH